MSKFKQSPHRLNLWIVTDPDTGQKGRWLGNKEFEFSENGYTEIINLDEVSEEEKESAACSFGYDGIPGLQDEYGDEWEWILAECLFEFNAPIRFPEDMEEQL